MILLDVQATDPLPDGTFRHFFPARTKKKSDVNVPPTYGSLMTCSMYDQNFVSFQSPVGYFYTLAAISRHRKHHQLALQAPVGLGEL